MESSFDQAWTLFGVGMVIVFAVLFLVVLTGTVIILLTNRLPSPQTANKDSGIPPPIMDVLASTVSKLTGNKGKITHIEIVK